MNLHGICTVAFSALLGLVACQSRPGTAPVANPFQVVGHADKSQIVLPVNQVLTPAGRQIELPGMRPQVLALSPDGGILVTSGKTHELVVIDPVAASILQRVPLPNESEQVEKAETVSTQILMPDQEGQASYTGLAFSPDGSRIYLANVNGSIKVFRVGPDHKVTPSHSWVLPPTGSPARKKDIPAGLTVSGDGKKLYVALNFSNRLLEMDATSGKALRFFDVGNAPYDVLLAGAKAYVSNWGGRRPDAESVTGPIGVAATVRVDPVRFIASEGSVSVVDLSLGQTTREILVGMHACALALSPNRRFVVAANANSDSVSVIDTRTDSIVETIALRWHAGDLFGSSPNALVFDRTGKMLFVCNGTQNAVAMVSFKPGNSKLRGLIPTAWFPGAIVHDAKRDSVYIANIKGIGSGKKLKTGEKAEFNTHQYLGTVSLIPVPGRFELAGFTKRVLNNYSRAVMELARLPERPGSKPVPVPERAGEPSVFKHVVYIIKENRTYDQVLGDMTEGNGDSKLCIFGEQISPNQHKIAREFVLLDNTYCSGILSADGHQWTDAAFATDYMEKSFAGFPRSYPDGMEPTDVDALAYSPTGFLWDNALAHGKTLRDYGEFTFGSVQWKDPGAKTAPTFLDIYKDFTEGTGLIRISSSAAIPSLAPHINTNTIGWNMRVPDVFRAAQFIKELKQFEQTGRMPELIIICLPNNHTSGTSPAFPTPAAYVADNDLAFGQIVEAISQSRFWPETCIFAIEDDPQNGWDHVSSYRTTAFVASPYTRRGTVIHNNYNQTSIIRTIELILGLPPMNQMDASATPMSACFTQTPDFTPYKAVPNNIPLDQMNPPVKAIKDPVQRNFAVASSKLPLEQIDQCPEDLFNRILWNAQRGLDPYPAWAITPAKFDFD